jgi:hypothetical protein
MAWGVWSGLVQRMRMGRRPASTETGREGLASSRFAGLTIRAAGAQGQCPSLFQSQGSARRNLLSNRCWGPAPCLEPPSPLALVLWWLPRLPRSGSSVVYWTSSLSCLGVPGCYRVARLSECFAWVLGLSAASEGWASAVVYRHQSHSRRCHHQRHARRPIHGKVQVRQTASINPTQRSRIRGLHRESQCDLGDC